MKHFLLSACLLVALSLNAQHFSGELVYHKKVIPKVNSFNMDSVLEAEAGGSSTYLTTNGYYKSTYYKDGKMTYSYTYHDDSKRMYDESSLGDYITFRDSRKGNTNRIRSIVYKDSIKTVVGQKCFMVERVYEKFISKTYYATDLKINPESFQGHAAGDWYNQIKEVNGALSLISVDEYATHIEIHEVTKIIPRKVKYEEFNLPDKKIILASTQALDIQPEMKQPSQDLIDCYQKKMDVALKELANTVNLTCYLEFIVSEDGAISGIKPYEEDQYGLHKVAVDIFTSCGFEFTPGQLEGKAFSSLTYFPFEFTK